MSHSSGKVAIVFVMGVISGALGSVILTVDNRPLTGASGMNRQQGFSKDKCSIESKTEKTITKKDKFSVT